MIRRPRSGVPVRCGACKRQARLASKRATWHRHRDKYLANKQQAQGAASGVVWTPEEGHVDAP